MLQKSIHHEPYWRPWFFIGIFWMINAFGTVSYHDLFNSQNGIITSISAILPTLVGITLLLFVGAIGKSAQIPFVHMAA